MRDIIFSPQELLLHNYECGGYVPCCVMVNTNDCKLKKITNMTSLTSYEDFQFEM
jgi:hypothetical protein